MPVSRAVASPLHSGPCTVAIGGGAVAADISGHLSAAPSAPPDLGGSACCGRLGDCHGSCCGGGSYCRT